MPGRVMLAYDADRLFALDQDGHLIALDAATGSQLWATQLRAQSSWDGPPVAVGGLVYAIGASVGSTLVAVDEQSGSVQWMATTGGTDGSVAVANGVVYVDAPCDLRALDAASGTVSWSRIAGCTGGGGWAPSVYATNLWERNQTFGNVVLDHDGSLLGTFPAFGLPAFHNGVAFYQTLGSLNAVDIATSTLRWQFIGDGQLCTSPVVAGAGGQVFIGACSGKVYELDEFTGAQWSVHDVGTAITRVSETNAISLADGHLLVPAGKTLVVY
jgi:outer membrane protein assembly factor BamB